jgi:hypothetical protein
MQVGCLDLYEAETPEDGGAQVAVRFALLRTITSNEPRSLVCPYYGMTAADRHTEGQSKNR